MGMHMFTECLRKPKYTSNAGSEHIINYIIIILIMILAFKCVLSRLQDYKNY